MLASLRSPLCSLALRNSSRSLVSSALLSRTWDNKTVADLKDEARKRGLTVKGTKATLITRIQEHDQRLAVEAVAPANPSSSRHASTATASATSPPSDPPAAVVPRQYLDIKLPDLSTPDPEPPVQIPFVPDNWESYRVKAKEESSALFEEPETPKIVVVAGSSTHAAGGPTHNLESALDLEAAEAAESTPSSSDAKGLRGVWEDIADDLGIPKTVELNPQRAFRATLVTEPGATSGKGQAQSRVLDSDEVRGAWAAVGVLVGAWVLGGVLQGDSAFAAHPEKPAEADTKQEVKA